MGLIVLLHSADLLVHHMDGVVLSRCVIGGHAFPSELEHGEVSLDFVPSPQILQSFS